MKQIRAALRAGWRQWPLATALLSALIAVLGLAFRLRINWLADLGALSLAYSVADILVLILARQRARCGRFGYWAGLCVGLTAAILLGQLMGQSLWPPLTPMHAPWLLPCVMLAVLTVTLVPGAIAAENTYQASLARREQELRDQLERTLLEARLAALQGQIEPHFLYNTLANTRALLRQDALAAEQMLNHLIAYLRAAMPDLRALTTSLGQELMRAEAYLGIMQLRLGARLHFQIAADAEARACAIPPLVLMTLVENAIQHGIEPQLGAGRLTIAAHCDASHLHLSVSDDGPGFQSETGQGVGLLNVHERLQALYGDAAELSLAPRQPAGVLAAIRLPRQYQNKEMP